MFLIGAVVCGFVACFHAIGSNGAMEQQYFRVPPKNVQAAVGTDINLICEVENLAGKVQWTKDGYALGFNVTIPGFPRYRFYADKERGVFNLFVKNVSLEDDAEFQCQVGPAVSPIMHKPIRAKANLTVISPPTTIEIRGRENNTKLEVRENHEIRLQCLARNAKPAPKIIWYRGRNELKNDNQAYNVTESENRNGNVRLYDVLSEIHLQPSVEDDAVNYTCEASHEALPHWKRLRSTVQLSVLYPPGLPYIEGYNEGDILRGGQKVELICRSRGGNPPAQLVWYKNGEQVGAVYRTLGRLSENVYSFIADMTDNKAKFTCEASSVINRTRLTTEVNLTVFYPPSSVTISGTSEARLDETISLTCTTGVSNPSAVITWMFDGTEVDNGTSRVVEAPEYGGWITYSNVTAEVTGNKTDIVVICYGKNSHINGNKFATHTITILYPPGQPVIDAHMEESYISAGDKKLLTCTSTGGNPVASLKWYRNDKEIPATVKFLDKTVVAETTILLNASDNEAIYKCISNNSAIDIPHIKTIKLPIYFPPAHAEIRSEPKDLEAGAQARLICDSSSSNPPADLSWWMDGLAVTEGVTAYSKPGLYGGKVSTIELLMNVTSDVDGRTVTCQAANEPLQLGIHETKTLSVKYKPEFIDHNKTIQVGTEEEPLVISFDVRANPPVFTYTWTKDGSPLTVSTARVFTSGSTLNITRLNRTDSGFYSCEAINEFGSSIVKFRISVLYPASIQSVTDVSLVDEGQSATLVCEVDGNPLEPEHVTWKRPSFAMQTRTTFSFRNRTSTLTVHDVRKEDIGQFHCVADNGVGNETSGSAYLVVKHKPIIDASEPLSKAASHIGHVARLVCRATGAPKVSFSWSRGGTVLPTNRSEKYGVLYRQLSVIEYASTLLVNNVGKNDFGTYGCTARNAIDSSMHTVRLQNVSEPDAPYGIVLVNATHDSVTIAWTSGFDGGEKTYFRIRYHELDGDKSTSKQQDIGNGTIFTIMGLELATCYNIQILAYNSIGKSAYSREQFKACSLSEGPPSLPSRGEVGNKDSSNRLPFAVGLVVALILVLLNVTVVIFCIVRHSKKKFKDNSNQPSNNKSDNVDLYSSNNFNDQMRAESITSVSEKSDNFDKGFQQPDEGRCSALNSYMIEEIDYPFQDTSAYEIEVKPEKLSAYRTSTICRNGSICQRRDLNAPNTSTDYFPPPIQFAQPPLLQYARGHPPHPPPDVTVQTAQHVPLSTFNYNVQRDGQLV